MSKIAKSENGHAPSRNFRLDKGNAKLMGVCSGIANYAGIDPMLVRAGFVIGGLVSIGTAGIVYVAIGLIAD
jgi:phage shock protein PspC (stress-responsive transcriptional regulator)